MNDLLPKVAHLGLSQLGWNQEQKRYERELEREAERKAQEEAEARAAALQPQQQDTGGYTPMAPEQQEWANMMINAMNQMGSSSNDPHFHSQLASQYLGLLGQLQPQREDPNRSKQEALEMIQLGQTLGDQDMVQHGMNALRMGSGMEGMPMQGTPEYSDQVRQQANDQYFQSEFPTYQDEFGGMTEEGMRNLEVQLAAQENPNLVKDYMDTDLNFFQKLFRGEDKEKELKLKKAGFPI
jgi:hypothetical protein